MPPIVDPGFRQSWEIEKSFLIRKLAGSQLKLMPHARIKVLGQCGEPFKELAYLHRVHLSVPEKRFREPDRVLPNTRIRIMQSHQEQLRRHGGEAVQGSKCMEPPQR